MDDACSVDGSGSPDELPGDSVDGSDGEPEPPRRRRRVAALMQGAPTLFLFLVSASYFAFTGLSVRVMGEGHA